MRHRRRARALTLCGALAAAGCAAVLGVDYDYVVVDGGAPTAAPAGIRCVDGGVFCKPIVDECCQSPAGTLSCVSLAGGSACSTGTDIPCDDSADCSPGEICCLNVDTDTPPDFLGTACLTTACPANSPAGGTWVALCTPDGGMPCHEGTSCRSLAKLPSADFAPVLPLTPSWFYACQ